MKLLHYVAFLFLATTVARAALMGPQIQALVKCANDAKKIPLKFNTIVRKKVGKFGRVLETADERSLLHDDLHDLKLYIMGVKKCVTQAKIPKEICVTDADWQRARLDHLYTHLQYMKAATTIFHDLWKCAKAETFNTVQEKAELKQVKEARVELDTAVNAKLKQVRLCYNQKNLCNPFKDN